MPVSRRAFLSGAAALPVAASLPSLSLAELAIGQATLTTVSDGNLVLPGSFAFSPMPKDELAPILAEFGLSEERLEPECNLALYRDGTNTVLFDAGSGPDIVDRQIQRVEAVLDHPCGRHEIGAGACVEEHRIGAVAIERQIALGLKTLFRQAKLCQDRGELVLGHGRKGKAAGQHKVAVAHRGQRCLADGKLGQGQ